MKLPFYEWVVVISLLFFLIILGSFSYLSHMDEDFLSEIKSKSYDIVHIEVSGAVAFPGVYEMEKDSSIKDLLMQAQLLPEANISKFKLDDKIGRKKKIMVPKIRKSLKKKGEE